MIVSLTKKQSYFDKINYLVQICLRSWNPTCICTPFSQESMIAPRATVFEKNTAVWVDDMNGDLNIPDGFQAVWNRRSHLAVAKLGDKICEGDTDFELLRCKALRSISSRCANQSMRMSSTQSTELSAKRIGTSPVQRMRVRKK